ncbi:MAG TPA: type II toxin-antitoxin system RelE/ParE family toxin [Phycisphaerae bacterium]|nr:type II toxin-antitoxin system RelE/ParE family toxin [Phycisphaerae bacterium]
MKQLIVTNPAINDLDEIWNHIASDSVEAADHVEAEFHAAMLKLCEAPWLGHQRSDVRNQTVRFWVVYSYLIAYRVEGENLYVWRVVHGARNIKRLFPRKQWRK